MANSAAISPRPLVVPERADSREAGYFRKVIKASLLNESHASAKKGARFDADFSCPARIR